MKKTLLKSFYIASLLILVTSCISVNRTIPVNIDDGVVLNENGNIETHLEPYLFKAGDELSVKILCEDPNLAKYLGTEFVDNGAATTSTSTSGTSMKPNFGTRTVDDEGYISIPRLGRIYVLGKDNNQAKIAIKESLKQLYKGEVTVKVDLANYVYYQLGDAGYKMVTSDKKLNLLEYFAQYGGFQNTNNLRKFKIFKKEDNAYKPIVLNLNKMSIISQKEFYLDNGDIIQIDPVKFKNFQVGTSSILTTVALITSVLTTYYIIKTL